MWVEGATPEEIEALKATQPSEPTLEERVAQVETDTDEIVSVLAEIVGVQV